MPSLSKSLSITIPFSHVSQFSIKYVHELSSSVALLSKLHAEESVQPKISSLSHTPSPSASFSISLGHVSVLFKTKPSG